MGFSPRAGASYPMRVGCSGFVGSMTNMDRVLPPLKCVWDLTEGHPRWRS